MQQSGCRERHLAVEKGADERSIMGHTSNKLHLCPGGKGGLFPMRWKGSCEVFSLKIWRAIARIQFLFCSKIVKRRKRKHLLEHLLCKPLWENKQEAENAHLPNTGYVPWGWGREQWRHGTVRKGLEGTCVLQVSPELWREALKNG